MIGSRYNLAVLVLLGGLALGAYGAILRWFELENFYYSHFYDRGEIVTRYNELRLVFGVFVAWLVYGGGRIVLSLPPLAPALLSLRLLDGILLCFFAGAGAWYLLLFIFGLLGWYTRTTMVILTVLILVASLPHLRDCLLLVGQRVPGLLKLSRVQILRILLGMALLVPAAGAFLLVKGIYPAGGHDYYTHYFYYYLSVVQNGSLAPNDVWYHFYYSKGAGLYFLAILLTDPLAPQIVTTVMIGIGALTVFALLRQVAPSTLIPWLGSALYLTFLVYTPGPIENMRHGGWGDLEKLHELAAVLTLGVVWISGRALDAAQSERRIWTIALLLSIASLILLTTVLAFLVGIFFLLLVIWFALRRNWRSAAVPLLGGIACSLCFAAILEINYIMTGLPLDQLVLYVWPIVNLQKLQSWGVLNEAIVLHWGMTGWLANKAPLTLASFPLLAQYLRLELWAPIALGASTILVVKASGRLKSGGIVPARLRSSTFGVLIALVAMLCLVFLVFGIGREQSISFYRFSSFMYAPTLCLFLGVWIYCPFPWRPFMMLASLVAGCALVWTLSFASIDEFGHVSHLLRQNVENIFVNARHFASGRFSIKDAYQNQQGWPGRLPWGGIYPAMESISRIVGPDVPIYTVHIHSYCMLPRCKVVSGWMSTRVARDSSTLFFGTPEDARRVLKDEGLNYFVISKELDIRSPLPRTPLFSPDNIRKYLAVKWTDGTTYLLTWPDATTTDIDDAFIAHYRKQIAESMLVLAFPFKELMDANEHFRNHGLRPYKVPWCTTCERMAN